MNRPYFVHIDETQKALAKIEIQSSLVFAIACAERLWPAYQRASRGKAWDNEVALRNSLDSAWKSLTGNLELSQNTELLCEKSIPENLSGPMAWAAREASVSFYSVVCLIRRQQVNGCIYAAKANLSVLDHFIYQLTGLRVSSENDIIVDEHELMKNEMTHQLEDLDILSYPLTPSLVENIRQRSFGKSVLGNYWL